MVRFVITFIAFSIFYNVSAQEKRRLVWESGIAINYQLFDHWRMNSSVFQRVSFLEDSNEKRTEVSFVEINQFFTRSLNYANRISVGYKFRSEHPVDDLSIHEHRLTQQFAHTHLSSITRVVSRIRTEQRIRPQSFAHRYRYRISADLPSQEKK